MRLKTDPAWRCGEMVKHELLNTRSCFKHRYIFPHMNNSVDLPLERDCGVEQAGERRDDKEGDKRRNDGVGEEKHKRCKKG